MEPVHRAFLVLVAVLAAERLGELALSRRNLGVRARDPGAAGRRNYAAMVAVHVALLVLPALEVLVLRPQASWGLFLAAACALLLAQALRYWSIHSLGRAWNARAVVDPSLGFVARGPYRWLRHPNYLAVVLEFLALPAAGGAWISWCLLNLVHGPILRRRIGAEDAELARIPGYAAAMGPKGGILPRPIGRPAER